jgi:predicted nuclease of predicted toxin-antitoxin system
MKLLFDHQLSPKLPTRLADLYPDSSHVYWLGLDQAADPVIWQYACEHDFTIVTKDVDYHDLCLLRGHPPKILWLRLGNCTTEEAEAAIRQQTQAIAEFLADPVIGILSIW